MSEKKNSVPSPIAGNQRSSDWETSNDKDKKAESMLGGVLPLVILLCGVTILLLLQLPFFQIEHPHIHVFTEELAFAMILAGLFSLTVEKYHRQEFRNFVIEERDKLKRNVFLYAYGHNVSEQTRREIRDLLECPFYREQLTLHWSFAPHPAIPGKVRLTKRITYIQKNGTHQPKPYQYKLHYNSAASLMESHSSDLLVVQTVRIRRKGKPDIDLPGPKGELEATQLDPLGPEEELEVCVTQTETRLSTGEDSYSCKHPVIGRTLVSVSCENGLDLYTKAWCKGVYLQERTDHLPPRFGAWVMDEGTLPYQGVVVSWLPATIAQTTALALPLPNLNLPLGKKEEKLTEPETPTPSPQSPKEPPAETAN